MTKSRIHRSIAVLFMVSLNFAAACGYHRVEVAYPDQPEASVLSFLEDSLTTRSDVISSLGREYTNFEGGKILIFLLDKQFKVINNAYRTRYHLVLVFKSDIEPILIKHSLVRIK
jgi:hypothetical protein